MLYIINTFNFKEVSEKTYYNHIYYTDGEIEIIANWEDDGPVAFEQIFPEYKYLGMYEDDPWLDIFDEDNLGIYKLDDKLT